MNTADKIADLREEYMGRAAHQFDYQMKKCESPIEQLLLAAVFADMYFRWLDMFEYQDAHDLVKRAGLSDDATPMGSIHENCRLFVQPKVRVDEQTMYRLDFAILAVSASGKLLKVAVETDGHDFHEKTKEQARRDKARDRALLGLGWRTVRFTGSEVYADPEACVESVINICVAALRDL